MPRSKLAKPKPQDKKKHHNKPNPIKAHRKANPKPQPIPQSEKPPQQAAPPKEPAVNGVWFDPTAQYRTCKQDGNLIQQAIDNGWKVPQQAKDELPAMLHHCTVKLAEQAETDPFAVPALVKLATTTLAMDAANQNEIRLALALKKDLRDEKELEHKLANPQNGTTVNVHIALQQKLAALPLEEQRGWLERVRQLKALMLAQTTGNGS
jgi:hypothetical protein